MKAQKLVQFLVLFLFIFSKPAFEAYANSPVQPALACSSCETSANCTEMVTTVDYAQNLRTIFMVLLLGIASVYFWKTKRNKVYLLAGIASGLILLASGYGYSSKHNNKSENTISHEIVKTDTSQRVATGDFKPAGDDFGNANNEFKPVGATSEFSSTKGKTGDLSKSDEFKTVDNNLSSSEFSEGAVVAEKTKAETEPNQPVNSELKLLYQIITLFLLIVIIGLTLRYGFVRKLRGLILLSSVVYLGFVRGACPCMIMSLQNFVLFSLGHPATWISMLWFLGLIPLTYFFGKVWCGWLCHLGGLQEFLFRGSFGYYLSSTKAQKIIKYIQISVFIILLSQLYVTRSNIFIHYDPFKVAYNLFSANLTGYILLVILLASSLLVYRPFCRMFCPVGLVLGWVTKIPGARKLALEAESCTNCKLCTKICKQHSIHHTDGQIEVNTEDCILCGDCISHCRKNSLLIANKRQ